MKKYNLMVVSDKDSNAGFTITVKAENRGEAALKARREGEAVFSSVEVIFTENLVHRICL